MGVPTVQGVILPKSNGHKKEPAPRGRPSKYDSKYCQAIVRFFNKPAYREAEVVHTNRKGETWSHFEDKANPPPFVSAFSRKIKVNIDTIYEWAKVHPDFSEALRVATQLKEEHVVTCGFLGLSNPNITALMLKTHHGYRDREPDVLDQSKHFHRTIIFKALAPTNGEALERDNRNRLTQTPV